MAENKFCDAYLRLIKNGQPVKGECADSQFSGAIELFSFELGSLSGFQDSEAFYADQNAGRRAAVGQSRLDEDVGEDESGMRYLFGDVDFNQEQAKYQGTDLADVDAAQFNITKAFDLSSPDLFRSYCSTHDAEHRDIFESATVTVCKATGGKPSPYLTFVFSDVVVNTYSLEVGGDGLGKETIALSFAKCRMEYKVQAQDGRLDTAAIKAGWSFTDRNQW